MTKKIDRTRFVLPIGTARYCFISRPSKTHGRYEAAVELPRSDIDSLVSTMEAELSAYFDRNEVRQEDYAQRPLYRDMGNGTVLVNVQRRTHLGEPYRLSPEGLRIMDNVRDGSRVVITGEIVPYIENNSRTCGVSLRMDTVIVHELQSADTRAAEAKAAAADRGSASLRRAAVQTLASMPSKSLPPPAEYSEDEFDADPNWAEKLRDAAHRMQQAAAGFPQHVEGTAVAAVGLPSFDDDDFFNA